jgi:hypothetical protein
LVAPCIRSSFSILQRSAEGVVGLEDDCVIVRDSPNGHLAFAGLAENQIFTVGVFVFEALDDVFAFAADHHRIKPRMQRNGLNAAGANTFLECDHFLFDRSRRAWVLRESILLVWVCVITGEHLKILRIF